jgi:epoxyqueuosine reductase
MSYAQNDLVAWVASIIQDFVDGPENSLQGGTGERAWDTPIIGFANGADPIFEQYKEVVGDFHWTPLEIFNQAFPDVAVAPEELAIISYILPQTEATKRDQRQQTVYPAERWARSRIFGEQFNDKLRRHVAETLTEAGYPAIAPSSTAAFKVHNSDKYVWASTWSERHAAHAAGLGTFGLCDGLITPVGKAMRASSVVARIPIPATPRPYDNHRAYCLWHTHRTCGKCIDRCPVGALSKDGHDKVKCRDHLNVTRAYVTENYSFNGYGCGLCQVDVPCESGIPNAKN